METNYDAINDIFDYVYIYKKHFVINMKKKIKDEHITKMDFFNTLNYPLNKLKNFLSEKNQTRLCELILRIFRKKYTHKVSRVDALFYLLEIIDKYSNLIDVLINLVKNHYIYDLNMDKNDNFVFKVKLMKMPL